MGHLLNLWWPENRDVNELSRKKRQTLVQKLWAIIILFPSLSLQ